MCWRSSPDRERPMVRLKRSTAGLNICAGLLWGSVTSPTTSPGVCSSPVASDRFYTLNYDEPLYQHNYKLSDTIQRPASDKVTDEDSWADAGLHGTTIAYLFNNKKNSSAAAKLEPYLDNNHWSDPCSQGGIGVGFGKLKTLPRWDEAVLDTKIHQSLTVTMAVPKGNAAWSHISAASSFVAYNCEAEDKAETDCIGLVGKWPE